MNDWREDPVGVGSWYSKATANTRLISTARRAHSDGCVLANRASHPHSKLMLQRSLVETLNELASNPQRPRINVGLIDRNRISMTNWVFGGDCLIDYWPSGTARHVIPLTAIVIIEVLQGEPSQ